MQMNRNAINMVRTTISLPEDLYGDLRLMSFEENRSISNLIVDRLYKRPINKTKSREEEFEKMFAFFRKVAKSGVQINATQAVREERDRDNV